MCARRVQALVFHTIALLRTMTPNWMTRDERIISISLHLSCEAERKIVRSQTM